MLASWPQRLLPLLVAALLWAGLFSCAHGAPLKKTHSEIELARENLRVSKATETRIASELRELKESGESSPEIINDYETYLKRVRGITDENRKVLRKMEAAYAARHLPDEKSTSRGDSQEFQDMANPPIQEEATVDELAALDRELDDSLAEFDEMLLKELDEIKTESAERMFDLAEEAAAAARRLREKGIDLDTSIPGSCSEGEEGGKAGEGEAQTGKEATGGKSQSETSSGEGEGSGAGEKKDGETGSRGEKEGRGSEEAAGQGQEGSHSGAGEEGRRPSNGQPGSEESGRDSQHGTQHGQVGTGGASGEGSQGPGSREGRGYDEDDDIVARQLREAAENETDPVLKEKLWKEYEEYKKGL